MVIMDLKDKRSESEDANSSSSSGGDASPTSQSPPTTQKSCSDCHTTRTPLWRGGPAGPKTLCNACGIKYNKKRRELLGLDTRRKDRSKKKKNNNGGSGNRGGGGGGGGGGGEVGHSMKLNLMALGWQRSGKPINKLGEEEQAAILLMALSCGSVYA